MSALFNRMLTILLLSLSLPTYAADDAAALTRLLAGINSMQADFAQQTSDAKGRPQPVQRGKMAVKRPGFLRWEVQQPAAQMVLTSGKVMWIYDPELMQATRQKLDDQIGNTPALLLSGDPRQLDAAFTISQETTSANEQVFVLKPRGKEALFESLRVRFQGSELLQMQLKDTLGQKTDIRFSNVQVNPALANKLFEFTPPKGVDVIDQF